MVIIVRYRRTGIDRPGMSECVSAHLVTDYFKVQVGTEQILSSIYCPPTRISPGSGRVGKSGRAELKSDPALLSERDPAPLPLNITKSLACNWTIYVVLWQVMGVLWIVLVLL